MGTRMYRRGITDPREAIEGCYEVQDRGYETPCWIWMKGGNRDGRGVVRIQGKNHLAYRLAYEAHVGPIPNGLFIDHLCRVPACLNPDHLEPVTDFENRRRAGLIKLSSADLREIFALLDEGKVLQKDIAAMYGVGKQHITRLKQTGRA